MRIVIDGQGLQSASRYRGIGRYTEALIRAMIDEGPGHEFVLALSGLFPETIDPIIAKFDQQLPREAVRVWEAPGPVSASTPENKWRRGTAELIREAFLESLAPDCILVCSFFEGLIDDAVTSIKAMNGRAPVVIVAQDIIPHLYREEYLSDPISEAWYQGKLEQFCKADLWLSISTATRDDLVRHLRIPRSSIVNISAAADRLFAQRRIGDERETLLRQRYALGRPFLMYTGGADPRKNMHGLVSAYATLPDDIRSAHQLAIVCQIHPDTKRSLEEFAEANGMAPDELVVTNYVPDDDLTDLYGLCKAFVFPSLYEGFGLPALEAMAAGKAVIASNTSSIPEVVGRNDALFDPTSEKSIRDKLLKVMTEDDYRARLEEHGLAQSQKFSWQQSARSALTALDSLHGGTNTVGRKVPASPTDTASVQAKPRLAYVSPLPPKKSGISFYSAELLPSLAAHYDIDVVVDQNEIANEWIKSNCQVRDVDWFRAHASEFDRVVYQLGNSDFHRHMFGLLDDIPGVVVLHDFFLSGVMTQMEITGCRSNFGRQSLYRAHGYPPLLQHAEGATLDELANRFPCSLEPLQKARHVISHSEHSKSLSKRWFGTTSDDSWSVIPLPRRPAETTDKTAARRQLELPQDDFLVCSFGMATPFKQSDRLVDAWCDSALSRDENAHLVFAGECPSEEFAENLQKAFAASNPKSRLTITGWLETETYEAYLAAADLAVQLRRNSRGEASSAVLDCMNYAIPTIVNAHGSMAELPDGTVWRLDDDFAQSDLSAALNGLWRDGTLRREIGDRGHMAVRTDHNPAECAALYRDAIEIGYGEQTGDHHALVDRIGSQEAKPETAEEYAAVAAAVSQSFPPIVRSRQLLLDISELAHADGKSGIQRAVRSVLEELLRNPPRGFRVEPVFSTLERGYRYAREFTSDFIGAPSTSLPDDPVEFSQGDVFLMLDLFHGAAKQEKFYQSMRRQGVATWAIVYDLLPVSLPRCFPAPLCDLHQAWLRVIGRFDGAVCISKSVSDDLADWLETELPPEVRKPNISWFHLGADIEASSPSVGMPPDAADTLERIASRPTFLMVGTIEPRKGYAQTLAAFNRLWEGGADINLVIVGREGWMVDSEIAELNSHPERGNRLIWLPNTSDEFLNRIYDAAACLLAASEGEGFGLPLVEAAQHDLPILARDLAVFREVAGEHASYFSGLGGEDLASAVQVWLEKFERSEIPRSAAIPRQTWAASVNQLLSRIPQLCRSDAPNS